MTGISALARLASEPVVKSAPRAFCADMILSVSSTMVGINRRAMVIIMARCVHRHVQLASGYSSRSMASVSAMGRSRIGQEQAGADNHRHNAQKNEQSMVQSLLVNRDEMPMKQRVGAWIRNPEDISAPP